MSLSKLQKSINKRYKDKGLPEPINEPKPIEYLSTGFPTLDNILGGGWALGKIIELWGTPGCGKTTLSLHTIAEAQKKGKVCVFVDSERAFNPEYAEKLGVDNKKLIYIKPEYGEQALEIIKEYIDSTEVSTVVVDSVASLLPKAVADRDMEKSEQAILARLLSRNIPKLIPTLDNNSCTLILINQIRYEIGKLFGNPETTTGGETLKFNAFMRLRLCHTEYLKEDKAIYADIVRALAKKTKSTEPFKETLLRMEYGKGFSMEYDKLQMLIKTGEIEKAGAWYNYKGKKFQGEEGILMAIKMEAANENPKKD